MRKKKDEADLLKALEMMYFMVHFADFVADKNSPKVLEQMISGDQMQMRQAAKYLDARHAAVDLYLAHAGKQKPAATRPVSPEGSDTSGEA